MSTLTDEKLAKIGNCACWGCKRWSDMCESDKRDLREAAARFRAMFNALADERDAERAEAAKPVEPQPSAAPEAIPEFVWDGLKAAYPVTFGIVDRDGPNKAAALAIWKHAAPVIAAKDAEIAKLKLGCDALALAADDSEKRCKMLGSRLNDRDDEIDRLRALETRMSERLAEKIADRDAANTRLAAEVAANLRATAEIEKLKAELVTAKQACFHHAVRVDVAEDLLDARRRSRERLTAERDAARASLAERTLEVAKLAKERDEARSKLPVYTPIERPTEDGWYWRKKNRNGAWFTQDHLAGFQVTPSSDPDSYAQWYGPPIATPDDVAAVGESPLVAELQRAKDLEYSLRENLKLETYQHGITTEDLAKANEQIAKLGNSLREEVTLRCDAEKERDDMHRDAQKVRNELVTHVADLAAVREQVFIRIGLDRRPVRGVLESASSGRGTVRTFGNVYVRDLKRIYPIAKFPEAIAAREKMNASRIKPTRFCAICGRVSDRGMIQLCRRCSNTRKPT